MAKLSIYDTMTEKLLVLVSSELGQPAPIGPLPKRSIKLIQTKVSEVVPALPVNCKKSPGKITCFRLVFCPHVTTFNFHGKQNVYRKRRRKKERERSTASF